MDVFRGLGFYVGSVVITQYAGQPAADAFIKRLTALGVRAIATIPLPDTPRTWPTSCPTTAWAKTTISKPPAPSWW